MALIWGYTMKKSGISSVSFLAAVNYPKIPNKNLAKADPASLSVFGWILNNFPWVLLGIAVLCFVFAAIGSAKRHKEHAARVERLRVLEAEQARKDSARDWDSFRHQQFVRQRTMQHVNVPPMTGGTGFYTRFHTVQYSTDCQWRVKRKVFLLRQLQQRTGTPLQDPVHRGDRRTVIGHRHLFIGRVAHP